MFFSSVLSVSAIVGLDFCFICIMWPRFLLFLVRSSVEKREKKKVEKMREKSTKIKCVLQRQN